MARRKLLSREGLSKDRCYGGANRMLAMTMKPQASANVVKGCETFCVSETPCVSETWSVVATKSRRYNASQGRKANRGLHSGLNRAFPVDASEPLPEALNTLLAVVEIKLKL